VIAKEQLFRTGYTRSWKRSTRNADKNMCMKQTDRQTETVSDRYKGWAAHKLQRTADDDTCKRYTQQCYFRTPISVPLYS